MSEPVLQDVLAPGLKVVFCGTAPGRVSAQSQAYYAHPQNKFWRILHAVGLTPVLVKPGEYLKVLDYGIGLTDIAKFTFGQDSELPKGSLGQHAIEALRGRILEARPAFLAFTSLTGGSKVLGRKVAAGEQAETLGTTRLWVLPSPSPKAGWAWSDAPWHALARAVSISKDGDRNHG